MKYRLGALISSLFAGTGGGRNYKALSFNPKFVSFHDEGPTNRNLLRGFECSRRSLYSFVHEEDEFSELGPSVAQGRSKMPKLMTEKPDFYLQNKKAPAGRFSHTESHANVRNVFLSLVTPASGMCPKPEKMDVPRLGSNSEFALYLPPKSKKIDIPILSNDSECGLEHEKNDREYAYLNNVSSITIENVPTTIDLVQLMQAVSKYGTISSACMRTLPDGLRCCDVEFENLISSQKAVTVGSISIRKNKMRKSLLRLHEQETCVIRINGISKETTDHAIHAVCKEIGPLEGLIKAGQDVDAIFSMKNVPDIKGILAKLNSTTLNNCQWSAYVLPTNSNPVTKLKHDDAKRKLGTEIQNCLSDVKAQLYLKRIHVEDLQTLHDMITHLEEDEYAFSN